MRAKNVDFRVICNGNDATIYLYDVIGEGFFGGIGPKQFAAELDKAKSAKNIDLRINSPGGDVFAGNTMFNLLKTHKATISVYIDGLAASIASVIAMAGDTIEMGSNAMMMIHDPWSGVIGTAADMRKEAELLDKVASTIVATYAERTGRGSDELAAMMNAETWFTADEAVAAGFADTVGSEQAVAAYLRPDLFAYKHMPAALTQEALAEPPVNALEDIEALIQTRLTQWRTDDAGTIA